MGNCKTKAERKRLIMVNKAKVFCAMLEQQAQDSLFIEKADAVNKPFINEYRERLNQHEERYLCRILTIENFEKNWYPQNMVDSSNPKATIKNICPWVLPNHLLLVYSEENNSRGSLQTTPSPKAGKERELIITELAFGDENFMERLKAAVA